jgi:dTDP-4-amino-4,6-dideoxygalactose transaminase
MTLILSVFGLFYIFVMISYPFYPWPHYGLDEQQAVLSVLRSGNVNYWTGQEGRQFELDYAQYTGRKHAIAVANGTLAIELALYALDIGQGDEVITPARTFIASASAIAMRGATPVIADIDPVSQTVTADTIEQVITPRTKAIICVHLAGWACPMESILELAKKYKLRVVEDCAQAHGAMYKGHHVGSLGDAAAFSFCQDKIISTGGEGGMLVLDDERLWKRAWSFKDHGKDWDAVYGKSHSSGFRWLHYSFGTNWRLTEMQSAIGRIQLRKLEEWVRTRQKNAAVLTEHFKRTELLRLTIPPKEIKHAYYKYYVFIYPERLKMGWDRNRIMAAINNQGVPCFSGSCSEIYLEKAFIDAGLCPTRRLPVAMELGETSLMFLVHPTLTPESLEHTGKVVMDVCAQASQ